MFLISNYYSFSVNFACDPDNENCAFHFNPRPNEGVVVRNANLGGWGDEERDYEAEFPFHPYNYFDAMFICTDDKYLVRPCHYRLVFDIIMCWWWMFSMYIVPFFSSSGSCEWQIFHGVQPPWRCRCFVFL